MKTYLDYKESIDRDLHTAMISLKELEKSYSLHFLSPNYKPYFDDYTHDINNIKKSFTGLSLLRKALDRDLIDLNRDISKMNRTLIDLDKENDKLQNQIKNMDDDSGAPRELEIVKYKYNEQFSQNIILLLALLSFVGLFIFLLNEKKIKNELEEILDKDLGLDIKENTKGKGSGLNPDVNDKSNKERGQETIQDTPGNYYDDI